MWYHVQRFMSCKPNDQGHVHTCDIIIPICAYVEVHPVIKKCFQMEFPYVLNNKCYNIVSAKMGFFYVKQVQTILFKMVGLQISHRVDHI
jgi:hypothetical protein